MIRDYEEFKKAILDLSTIDLNSYKERQMKRRLDALIRKHGFKGYDEYVTALKSDMEIYKEFITYMTINVSEFFRNANQWELLESTIFPYIFDRFGKNITIWSAACSTGDEPYSLAMILGKFMPLRRINIIATDIDAQILEKAKTGLYNAKSVAGVPPEFKNKYFEKVGPSYKICDEIKNCIKFKQHDLLKDSYPRNVDLIVCRNVLIYFTEDAKHNIYTRFNQSLKKDGILFVGSTEQIIQSFRYNFVSEYTFFYRKEGEIESPE